MIDEHAGVADGYDSVNGGQRLFGAARSLSRFQ
jgi:hypothetical protein